MQTHTHHARARRGAIRLLDIVNVFAIGVLIVLFFQKVAPYNMDEFYQYHPIICRFFPGNMANFFRENCREYDLNLFNAGIVLPLRAFPYTGSMSALLYFPLYFLWPSPLSARFLGYLFLCVQAWCLARVARGRFAFALAGLLLFFPYAFQHIADTGPVGLQTTTVFLLWIIAGKWIRTLRWRWPLAAALLVFAGIWSKLAYAWLVPGIAAMGVVQLWDARHLLSRSSCARLCLQGVCSMALLLGLLSALFFSTNPLNSSQYPLWDRAYDSENFSVADLLSGSLRNSGAYRVMLNPWEAAQRIFAVPGAGTFTQTYAALLYAFAPLLLFVLACTRARRSRLYRNAALFYGLFLLTFFMIVRTKAAWAMHHSVLSLPFLALSVACMLALVCHRLRGMAWSRVWRAAGIGWVGAMTVCNAIVWSQVPSFTVKTHDDSSKLLAQTVLSVPGIAQRYVIVAVDWGMYYYQGLYGDKNQSVVYMEPFNHTDQVRDLRTLAKATGRKVLFVYNAKGSASDLSLIRDSFPVRRCSIIPRENVWQILAEPSAADGICLPESFDFAQDRRGSLAQRAL